ncbi:MAG: helical backbone metal receptor [Bacteroidia bacterium]
MKFIYAVFFILLLPGLVSCNGNSRKKLAQEAPLISKSYTDGLGRSVQLARAPQRVVSIAPNITEIMYAIGASDKLIAGSEACDFPAATDTLPRLVTYPSLDLEQIQFFKPDLILTTDEIFTPDQIERIEAMGTPVFVQSYQSLDDVFDNMRELGEVLGKKEQANHVADSLKALVERIAAKTDNEVKFGTLIFISDNPLKVVGGKGVLHNLIGLAGGENAMGKFEDPYPEVTSEAILQAKPEVIIFPSNDEQIYANLLAEFPWLSNTPADVNKRIFIMDPDLLYRPGPRMVTGLLQLTQSLHSGLTADKFLERE